MGLFDLLFTKPKSTSEILIDGFTKGDFSTRKADPAKIGAIAIGALGAAAKVGADVSHAQSVVQDDRARDKDGKR